VSAPPSGPSDAPPPDDADDASAGAAGLDHLDDLDEDGAEAAPAAVAPAPAVDGARQQAAAAEDPRYLRCFIAINFPVPTVRRIADQVSALVPQIAAAGLTVRWVPAANIHLTLRFLGPVRPEAVEAIQARLADGLRGARPFDLDVRGLGAFPGPVGPRVLWVGVREQPALRAVQREVEAWMQELGFARDERPYRPHATIGRVTGGRAEPADLTALLGEQQNRGFGTGRVTEVVVYESRTLAKGAEYRPLARVPLLGK